MSTFFQRFQQAQGQVEDKSGSFEVIPGGTVAHVAIHKAELVTTDWGIHYQFNYKLLDTDYKGRVVFHKVQVFDNEEKKAERHMNMLKKMYNICGVEMVCSGEYPVNQDLVGFVNKQLIVTIRMWEMISERDNYNHGNWISQVEMVTQNHQPVNGTDFPIGEEKFRAKEGKATVSNDSAFAQPATMQQPVQQQATAAMQANPVMESDDSIPF